MSSFFFFISTRVIQEEGEIGPGEKGIDIFEHMRGHWPHGWLSRNQRQGGKAADGWERNTTDREGFRGSLMVSSTSKGECKTLGAQKIEKRVWRKQVLTLMCGEELGICHDFSWTEVWQLFRGRDEIMGLHKGPVCLLHSCRAPVKEWMRSCPMGVGRWVNPNWGGVKGPVESHYYGS